MPAIPPIRTFLLILLSPWMLNGQLPVLDSLAFYANPVAPLDFSDPDIVAVGKDYYLVASSFNCVPALPLLHSTDLVHWRIVNHLADRLEPLDHFSFPRHGNGVWAPSIRSHDGWIYVFYGDPDHGLFMSKTTDPYGIWSQPVCIRQAKGWIDPCPFWDDDGKAYLIHAFAGSRAGIKSVLVLHEMATDGSALLDDGILVFDGHTEHPTIEGPKLYKRNGYYYIFAPAGGVAKGWQTVLRSKNIRGPYEDRIVLEQGSTEINGPHQGAWVNTPDGNDWFMHFQEKQPFGRILHLQPLEWKEDWPVIGLDQDEDGKGIPVQKWPYYAQIEEPADWDLQGTDEFNDLKLGLSWQWHANPKSEWSYLRPEGFLRLNPVILDEFENLWNAPNLLLQKLQANARAYDCRILFHPNADGEKTGLLIMGLDYAWIGLEQNDGQVYLKLQQCTDADKGTAEMTLAQIPYSETEVFLHAEVDTRGQCRFYYSPDGQAFHPLGDVFQAREGKWIGAKIGLFCFRKQHQNDGGYADIDWFRIKPYAKNW